VSIHGVS